MACSQRGSHLSSPAHELSASPQIWSCLPTTATLFDSGKLDSCTLEAENCQELFQRILYLCVSELLFYVGSSDSAIHTLKRAKDKLRSDLAGPCHRAAYRAQPANFVGLQLAYSMHRSTTEVHALLTCTQLCGYKTTPKIPCRPAHRSQNAGIVS